MGKNIVVCLDGTGNQLQASGNTNVVELYEMLDLGDPTQQIAYYDPGVGTFSAGGTWTPVGRGLSRLTGLAFGTGLKTNLAEAYTFLMRHYEPDDRIFLFGFSRGAYTARALAGMVKAVGLLRPGAENLVHYAVSVYARNKTFTDDDWARVHRFAEAFSAPSTGRFGIPVHYMGLWDTVKAAGVLRWNMRWPYTRQLPNALTVRHAISIDEKRRPYREYLVVPDPPRPPKSAPSQKVEQVWFSGVHSDVGGSFEDDPKLSTIARKWVVDGALDAGILLKPLAYDKTLALTPEHADGKIHRMGWVWGLLTYRRRSIPADADVHISAKVRADKDQDYGCRIPHGATSADEDWLKPWSPVPKT